MDYRRDGNIFAGPNSEQPCQPTNNAKPPVFENSSLAQEARKQQESTGHEDTPTRDAMAFHAVCQSSGFLNQYEMRFDRQSPEPTWSS